MTLDEITRAAQAIPGIASATLFVTHPNAAGLHLGAASGIEGPALDGLVAAVQNQLHPVAKALGDAAATFDVAPMNPGGPALRSHLPLNGLGVLALAHDASLPPAARAALQQLADSAAALLATPKA